MEWILLAIVLIMFPRLILPALFVGLVVLVVI